MQMWERAVLAECGPREAGKNGSRAEVEGLALSALLF